MSRRAPRKIVWTRREALTLKVRGESLALMQLTDLKKRIDAALDVLTKQQKAVAQASAKYGATAFAEQLTDQELEDVLNVIPLIGGAAQHVRVTSTKGGNP